MSVDETKPIRGALIRGVQVTLIVDQLTRPSQGHGKVQRRIQGICHGAIQAKLRQAYRPVFSKRRHQLELPLMNPSESPSERPSGGPSVVPSGEPSELPSLRPSECPTSDPSYLPSSNPSKTAPGVPSGIP